MAANVVVRQMQSFDNISLGTPPSAASSGITRQPTNDESFDFLTNPDQLANTTSTSVPDSKRRTLSGDRYASSALDAPDAMPDLDFPFMRAEHSFDALSLSNQDAEQDPSSICLSFAEGDIVFAHGFHESGWGDVTLLHTGKRGWIPVNYFSPFADVKAIPLLSAAAGFIHTPKSYRIVAQFAESSSDIVQHTFSQAAINEIVSGVRSLLELSGTLNRDSPVAQRSLTIRRYRKALLTELAYVVSLARENKRTLDDAVIDKLVRGVYRVVMKAAALLDVWAVDEKLHSVMTPSDEEGPSPPDSPIAAPHTPHVDPSSFPPTPTTPTTPAKATHAKRNSISTLGVHATIPEPRERIKEVVECLCEYLMPFTTQTRSEKNASVEILAITRHGMLACRELLIVIEAVANASEHQCTELEHIKEKLFSRIRLLVSSARYLVTALGDTQSRVSAASQKLARVATECVDLAREGSVWCETVLDKLPEPLSLPERDYPLFKERPLSAASTQLLSGYMSSATSVARNTVTPISSKRMSTASSIATTISTSPPSSPKSEQAKEVEGPLSHIHSDIVVRGQRVRGGTLPAIIAYLMTQPGNSFLWHAFLFTFRLHTASVDLASALVEANAVGLAVRWLESYFDEQDIPALDILAKLDDIEDKIELRKAWPTAKQLVERSLAGEEGSGASMASSTVTLSSISSSRRTSVSRGRFGSQDDMRHLTGLHSLGSAFRLGAGANSTLGTRLLEYDPTTIAAQLALMDAEIFEQLKVDELLDQRFAASKRSLCQAPHVVQLVLMSNHLSAFIAETILGAENLSAKTRKSIIRLWIKVAQACYECGHLNGVVTIVSTLQSANIIRLRKIWSLLSTKNMAVLEKLSRLAAPERNFQGYRQETKARQCKPTIPYFGLYLSDLTFIDEGNPKKITIRPGLEGINLDRYLKAARAISELQQFQRQLPLDVSANVPLQGWLRQEMARSWSSCSNDSDSNWRRSLFIEPRQ
ncbi:Ras-specific guanine nucleotide-releasing factor RalGPS1 [Wickerhamiella sorbophila]|uniref:Ras-specific guanine nucleotide-releasing factor RalGPS1 n=1 Tax=Wickerhamiella sorbophila TaxID=45607 RepID=A0A2T0FHT2_9ASCO|nr:Ras-specific guanine nucleotide-releasing factor RalGPS1 [Wickerhamiella sorbophila]PRT54517.1 Ras-specific guanine nucleotide-releasing factor RalGPS1 [Wickerhamiella sorbophila]